MFKFRVFAKTDKVEVTSAEDLADKNELLIEPVELGAPKPEEKITSFEQEFKIEIHDLKAKAYSQHQNI